MSFCAPMISSDGLLPFSGDGVPVTSSEPSTSEHCPAVSTLIRTSSVCLLASMRPCRCSTATLLPSIKVVSSFGFVSGVPFVHGAATTLVMRPMLLEVEQVCSIVLAV